MPKVSQQHRDARREQILAAARRCFLRDGFHATSMQDLFAEAGLSSGAVYGYFASKDDVIVAIAEENMRGVTEMIHTLATQHPSRPAGAVLADVMDMLHAQDARDGLGKLTVIVWSEALRNPLLAAQLTAMVTRYAPTWPRSSGRARGTCPLAFPPTCWPGRSSPSCPATCCSWPSSARRPSTASPPRSARCGRASRARRGHHVAGRNGSLMSASTTSPR